MVVSGAEDKVVADAGPFGVHLESSLIIRSALQVITDGIDGLKHAAAAAQPWRAQRLIESRHTGSATDAHSQ